MITIDLLKGRGRPAQSNPRTIAGVTILFMIPLVCGLAMATQYVHNGSGLSLQQKTLQQLDKKTAGLDEQVSFRQSTDLLMSQTKSCLLESVEALPRYNQWSPILTAIAQHLPENFVLRELLVKKKTKAVEIPKKGEPDQTITIRIPARTLHISIYHSDNQLNDTAVQEFIENLQATKSLEQQVEKFRLVGHQLETLDGQDVTRYDIDVTLKTAY